MNLLRADPMTLVSSRRCDCHLAQMEKEFPEMLPIKESLIKYVFEPNAAKKEETLKAVKAMRGR